MGAPASLLGNARAFARDFPRDQMPAGFLWDVVDYVPALVDSQLTGRGPWEWGSPSFGSGDDAWAGIVANFPDDFRDRLLVQTFNHVWQDVSLDGTTATSLGYANFSNQNPVQLVDTVIHCSEEGELPQLITASGGTITVSRMHSSFPAARRACVYRGTLIMGGAPGEEDVIRYSVPGENLATAAAYDANSFHRTSRDITALAAMRSMVLIFHKNSVERVRGWPPPHTDPGAMDTSAAGDMILEFAFERIGCSYPKSIATWNENVIFADEHGVHMTDGSIVRNITAQGNILSYWRQVYDASYIVTACVFLDYYIVTLRYSAAVPPITLICDLNRRQWYRFTNIHANTYIISAGGIANPYEVSGARSATPERVWVGQNSSERLIRIDPCFFPALDGDTNLYDGDSAAVLPSFETSWYRLGQEGRKRVRFAYLSYNAPVFGPDPTMTSLPRPVLEVGYKTSPQEIDPYVVVGQLPETRREYTRYRFPVGKFPYGVAFRVRQLHASSATRIYDLAAEAQPAERSNV